MTEPITLETLKLALEPIKKAAEKTEEHYAELVNLTRDIAGQQTGHEERLNAYGGKFEDMGDELNAIWAKVNPWDKDCENKRKDIYIDVKETGNKSEKKWWKVFEIIIAVFVGAAFTSTFNYQDKNPPPPPVQQDRRTDNVKSDKPKDD